MYAIQVADKWTCSVYLLRDYMKWDEQAKVYRILDEGYVVTFATRKEAEERASMMAGEGSRYQSAKVVKL
jgi:hypothetical protein